MMLSRLRSSAAEPVKRMEQSGSSGARSTVLQRKKKAECIALVEIPLFVRYAVL